MSIFSTKTAEGNVAVSNTQGIHIRPATNIYLLCEEYPCTNVVFSLRNRSVRASNINEILSLAAGYGDEIEVSIYGPSSKKLLKKLKALFADFEQYKELNRVGINIFNVPKEDRGYGRLLDHRCW